MTPEDRELREALAPLAGDPVADAARVLRGLPHPGVPPVAWWFLGVGVAVGVVLALWATQPTTVEPDPPANTKEVPDEQPDEKPDKKPELQNPWADQIYVYGLGQLQIQEPGGGEQLISGTYEVPFGTRFTTGLSIAGMLMAGEVIVRLDEASVATLVSRSEIALTKGTAYVVAGSGPDPVQVQAGNGIVDVVEGRAMIVRTDDQLRVVCLEGRAELRVPGQAVVRVAPQTMANLSASRVRSEKVDFLPRYTSWMTRLIVRQEDQAEREGLVKRMVEHYFGDEFRDEARAELRKLGSAAVMPMIQGLEARPNLDARFQLQTARLICRALAGPDNILQLFYLLKSRVPDVRVLAYETIYEKTDDSYGTGDAFWRAEGAAAENERRIVIDEWFEHEKRK